MTIPNGDWGDILSKLVGFLGGGTLLTYAIGRVIARRVVKDGLENAKDRAETEFVQSLTEHNKALREEIQSLATERNTAMAEKGRLEALLQVRTEQLTAAQSEIGRLQMQLQYALFGEKSHTNPAGAGNGPVNKI